MTNILDNLKADVTAALSGTLRAGTLWQYSVVDDGYGNEVPVYDSPSPCEGVRGSFDSVLASVAGIPRTDAKIELLAGTLAVQPHRLDKINIDGGWWRISDVAIDPAGAMWVCQCQSTTPVA